MPFDAEPPGVLLSARTEGDKGMPPTSSQIIEWVSAHQDEAIELIKQFVAIPSENRPPGGDEEQFQRFYASTLQDLGMQVSTFDVTEAIGIENHHLYWPGREYANRPNVVGRLKGTGSGKSLLLTGHGDVVIGVPGEHAPFTPVLDGDRLYGRGSNDMKGGLAAAVMAVRCLRDLGVCLQGDLLLESVVDEEMGGANGTLASRLLGNNADAAVILEPSNLLICPSHLGGRVFRVIIRGKGGMGFGGGQIVNAIYGMAHMVAAIEEYAAERMARVAPFAEVDPGRGLDTIPSIVRAGDFEPGQGDGAPTMASLDVWVESFFGTTSEELDAEFFGFCNKVAASDPILRECSITYEYVTRFLEGSKIDAGEPIIASVSQAMSEVLGPVRTIVQCAPFACDGFILHQFGVPAVIMGPAGDNAHTSDEYVSCQSIYDLIATLAVLISNWCGTE
jgi:acetylornithine deacetylase